MPPSSTSNTKKIREYEKRPGDRRIHHTVAYRYIGKLTVLEFDIIDLVMVSGTWLTTEQIGKRMNRGQESIRRQLGYMRAAGVLESQNQPEERIVMQDVEHSRATSWMETEWMPTSYGLKHWHLALGESEDDDRHQHSIRTLETLRRVWKASDASTICHTPKRTQPYTFRTTSYQWPGRVRVRNVHVAQGDSEAGNR